MTALELIQRAFRLIQVAPPGADETASTRTVQDTIKRVLRILSVVDAEEALSASQLTTGAAALNDMLTRWQRDGVIAGLTLPLAQTATVAVTQQAMQAIEYNLARLLASEFGAPLRADVIQLAESQYQRLALDVPHTVAGALRAMNDMIARWKRDGVGMSYNAVDIGNVDQDVTLPEEAFEPVAYCLAVKLAAEIPTANVTPLVLQGAKDGYEALWRDSQGVVHADLDQMPAGRYYFNINSGLF